MATERVEVLMSEMAFVQMKGSGLYDGRRVVKWEKIPSYLRSLDDRCPVFLHLEVPEPEPEKIIQDTRPRFEYKILRIPGGLTEQEQGLNRFGAEGWELVAIDGNGLFYFKRSLVLDKS